MSTLGLPRQFAWVIGAETGGGVQLEGEVPSCRFTEAKDRVELAPVQELVGPNFLPS